MYTTILGLLAGILTSSSFFPQAYKIIKTRNVNGISVVMYSLFTTGIFLWIIFGFLLNNLAIILTNIVTFIPALIILYMTIKYQKK